MAAPLDPKLADLLVRLVNLDNDSYETFQPSFPGGGAQAQLIGFDDETVPEGPLKELTRLGYLEMEVEPGKKLGPFSITPKGRSLGIQLMSTGNRPIDLSWSAVEPILRVIHDMWKREGAPPLGVPGNAVLVKIGLPLQAPAFNATLAALKEGDWVDFRQGLGPSLPQGLRPTSRTLALFEGWPTQDGQIVGEQFVALLEKRIEDEPDEQKRSKLRAALETGGSAFRELSVEVVAAIVARQVGG
jgi:hypothetical protein